VGDGRFGPISDELYSPFYDNLYTMFLIHMVVIVMNAIILMFFFKTDIFWNRASFNENVDRCRYV